MTRQDLQHLVKQAITRQGGEASIVEVAKFIWDEAEAELRASGDLFYTWQYKMRWAAQRLRDEGKLSLGKRAGKNVWQIT